MPPVGRHAGELLVRLGREKIGARLGELLIEIGRIDQGEDLAFFYIGTDVLVPFLHIAAGARIDGPGVEGVDRSGQNQLLLARRTFRLDDRDRRDRLLIGPPGNLLDALGAFRNTDGRGRRRSDGDENSDDQDAAGARHFRMILC